VLPEREWWGGGVVVDRLRDQPTVFNHNGVYPVVHRRVGSRAPSGPDEQARSIEIAAAATSTNASSQLLTVPRLDCEKAL